MEEPPCCSKELSLVRTIIILNMHLFIYGCAGSPWLQVEISLVVVSSLLIAGLSPVAEHGLEDTQASVIAAPGLQSAGLVVAVHGLSCSKACGIFPDQRSNRHPLYRKADS